MQIPLYKYLAATWNSSTRGRYLMAMKLFWSKWPSSGCDPKLSQKFSAKLLCQVPFKEQSCAVWSGEELVRLLTIITAYFTEIVWLTLNLHYILLQNKTSERLQNILKLQNILRTTKYLKCYNGTACGCTCWEVADHTMSGLYCIHLHKGPFRGGHFWCRRGESVRLGAGNKEVGLPLDWWTGGTWL